MTLREKLDQAITDFEADKDGEMGDLRNQLDRLRVRANELQRLLAAERIRQARPAVTVVLERTDDHDYAMQVLSVERPDPNRLLIYVKERPRDPPPKLNHCRLCEAIRAEVNANPIYAVKGEEPTHG